MSPAIHNSASEWPRDGFERLDRDIDAL